MTRPALPMSPVASTLIRIAMTMVALLAVAAQAATITNSCSGVGQERALCQGAAQDWAAKSGHQVRIVTPPNDANARLALYRQLLGAGADSIDVLQVDVVWPGLLGSQLLDLRPHARGAERQHFEGFIANNTHRGSLVAMPWFANAGLLFYRKDLLDKHGLPVPSTWEALATTARAVQDAERAAGNARMWGYVWQGRAYEGLSCNALEWVASHGGGAIVAADGTVDVNNPRAAQALRSAASRVGTISPTAVLNYAEEESRAVFQAGDAVFMRNWPYAWALAQAEGSAIRGLVGVAALPKGGAGGRHVATLSAATTRSATSSGT